MKTVLITGSNGLLGQELVKLYAPLGDYRLIATSRDNNRLTFNESYTFEPMDITDPVQVGEVLAKFKPDTIINTAAMTNVDMCEEHKSDCHAINVDGVANLLECSPNTHFIQVSTDFVFDGKAGPYSEEDETNPLSYYAKTKLEAENLVEEKGEKYAIARTIIVYGYGENLSRSNIVKWAVESLRNDEQLSIVDDQFRSPCWAPDLATGCRLIEKNDATGIYNIAGPETFSMYEMVRRIARYLGKPESLVKRIDSKDLARPAPRPMKTGLVIDKARRELGYDPHTLEQSLQEMLMEG